MRLFAGKFLLLALLLALPGVAQAAQGAAGGHSAGSKMSDGGARLTDVRDGKMPSGMAGMHMMGGGMKDRPYSDRAFLSAMIPHHEGAIEMAREVLAKGKDGRVKKWAEEVIKAQEGEIKEMRGWLAGLGGSDEQAARMMSGAMHGMMPSPMNADPDRNFVEMMIYHHAGALEMATESIVKSENRDVLRLSRDIIEAQAREIYEYKIWLLEKR